MSTPPAHKPRSYPYFERVDLNIRHGHLRVLGPAVATYWAILSHCNVRWKCRLMVKTIAAEAGKGRRVTQLHLRRLEQRGYVLTRPITEESSEYTVVVPLPAIQEEIVFKKPPRLPRLHSAPGAQNFAPGGALPFAGGRKELRPEEKNMKRGVIKRDSIGAAVATGGTPPPPLAPEDDAAAVKLVGATGGRMEREAAERWVRDLGAAAAGTFATMVYWGFYANARTADYLRPPPVGVGIEAVRRCIDAVKRSGCRDQDLGGRLRVKLEDVRKGRQRMAARAAVVVPEVRRREPAPSRAAPIEARFAHFLGTCTDEQLEQLKAARAELAPNAAARERIMRASKVLLQQDAEFKAMVSDIIEREGL